MNDLAVAQPSRLFSLMRMIYAAQVHADSTLSDLGLSVPKLVALSVLREAGDSLPLGQLADRLGCAKSNMTQLADRLEADGFINRAADPHESARAPRRTHHGGSKVVRRGDPAS